MTRFDAAYAPLPAWASPVEVVVVGSVARVDAPTRCGVLWEARRDQLRLEVPEVATYLVTGGARIEVAPAEDADAPTVERFLRSTPLAAVALQRRMTVLHAAAVTRGGEAVVLAGESMSGKTAVAEALRRDHGFAVLTDDVLPLRLVRGVPTALSPTSDDEVPVRAVWWLSSHNRASVETTTVAGMARFAALQAMVRNGRIADVMLDRAAFLRLAGALAAPLVPLRRLGWPRGRDTVGEVADLVGSGGGRPA